MKDTQLFGGLSGIAKKRNDSKFVHVKLFDLIIN